MIVDDTDFAWAMPLVDEARAAVTRGETLTLEEAVDDIDEVLRSSPDGLGAVIARL